jgi:hypothetical protein
VVLSRFRETGNRILVILRDFSKFDKCTSYSRTQINLLIVSVNKTIKETNYISLEYGNPLGEFIDFRGELK